MKVIAFTGMPCAGKSEAVELAKQNDILVVRMGDLIWEETEKRGLCLDAKNVGFVANEMRKIHGNDIWAKRTVEKINSLSPRPDVLVIDGLRTSRELVFFKKNLEADFLVVAIIASDKTRLTRFLSRNRTDDSSEESEFVARDDREKSWGLVEAIKKADISIENETGFDEFKEKIIALFDDILSNE